MQVMLKRFKRCRMALCLSGLFPWVAPPLFESITITTFPFFPLPRVTATVVTHPTNINNNFYIPRIRKQSYPSLFAPSIWALLLLRVSALMGSMHTGLKNILMAPSAWRHFYAERARHGVALIVTGGTAPVPPSMTGGAMLNDASQLTPTAW